MYSAVTSPRARWILAVLALFCTACGAPSTTPRTPTVAPTSPVPPTVSGLVLYYPFDGDARDASGNGHHGQVIGAVLTADRFGVANHAYYGHWA